MRSRFLPVHGRVPHTFAVFECVGDHESVGGNLAAAGRYDNSFPLIPTSGMSGAPGHVAFLPVLGLLFQRRCFKAGCPTQPSFGWVGLFIHQLPPNSTV